MREYRPAFAGFLLMMSMALTTTALSFFVEPVCNALVVGRGTFTVYYSIMTATGTLAMPVLGQIVQKRGVRTVVAVSAIWVSLGLLAFSVSRTLWMFYTAGAWIGIFGTACVSLCASVIVQQNYAGSRASGILGIVMAGSGVGGMTVSLSLPGVLNALGWRWGYRVLAACWLVLGLSALALLGKETRKTAAQQTASGGGMTRAQALQSPKMYLLIVVSIILSAACGIQQQLPSVLTGYGFPSAGISVMMSFFTAALALGKVVQGLFYGRVGAVRGGMIVTGLFAVSFVILLFPGFAWLAIGALAVGMGTVTTLMPLVTRQTFGSREYPAIWGIVYSAANLGTLFSTPLYGLAYDVSGSYDPAMRVSAFALLLCVGLIGICFRKK